MKLFLRVLCLLLVFALCVPALAQPAESRNILSDDPLGSLTYFAGNLYAMGTKALYRINPDTGDITKIAEAASDWPGFERLFADEEGMIGFDSTDASLYRLDISASKVEIAHLVTVEAWSETYMMHMDFRAPYLLASGGNKVYRLDIETGKSDAMEAGQVNGIAAYKDGQAVTIEATRTGDGWQSRLYFYDFDAGKKAQLAAPQGDLGWGLVYDEGRNMFYTASSLAILAYTPGDDATVSIAPIPKGDAYALTLMPDRMAVITDGDFLAIRPKSAGAHSTASLTMLAPLARAGDYKSFYQDHPETDLVFIAGDPLSTPEERFVNDMVSRSGDIDVYLLSDQNLLDRIKEKGFALPLGNSDRITQWVNCLETPFWDAFTRDGHVYAVPQEVFVNMNVYNRNAFQELGLEVPETYAEFLDFCILWLTEMADEHTQYRADLLDTGLNLTNILARIVAEQERNRQPLSMNTTEILKVVTKVAQVARLMQEPDMNAREWLIYQYYLPTLTEEGEHLLLRLDKDNQLALPVGADDLKYLVINPYTPHADTAIKLLEGVIGHQEGHFAVVLDKTQTKPIPNPWFKESLARFDASGQELRSALANAEGAEKRTLEASLKAFAAEREAFIAQNEHQFGQAAVDRARALAKDVYIPRFNPIWQLAQQYPDMFEEYRTNPNFDAAQFLERLDGMVATALAEQE